MSSYEPRKTCQLCKYEDQGQQAFRSSQTPGATSKELAHEQFQSNHGENIPQREESWSCFQGLQYSELDFHQLGDLQFNPLGFIGCSLYKPDWLSGQEQQKEVAK